MFDVEATSAAAYAVEVVGDDFRFLAANQACIDLVGITSRFYPGLTPLDIFPPAIAEQVLARYRGVRDLRQAVSYLSEDLNLVSSTSRPPWRTTLLPILDATGRVCQLVGLCVDASEEVARFRVETSLRSTIESVDSGFWIYEMDGGRFETSRSLAELLAGPGHASLDLAEYVSHIHAEDFHSEHLFKPREDDSDVEYRVVTHEGRTLWLKSQRRMVRDEADTPIRVVSLVTNITSQKHTLQTLEFEASTDSLTSIRNRRSFDKIATASFRAWKQTGKPVALLLLDLDDFKPLNDRYGHRAGDLVLRKVAKRLARLVKAGDTLARIGGDEFAILLPDTTVEANDLLESRIARAFRKPITIEGHELAVGASFGLAISTPGDLDANALFDRADRALYIAKKESRLVPA